MIVVGGERPAAAVAGLDLRWATVDVAGHRAMVSGYGEIQPGFVTQLELSRIDDAGSGDVALALTLPCWTLLGMLDRAIELTVAHVTLRKQFGQPLASFQGVQFQLTDAEVDEVGEKVAARGATSVPEGSGRDARCTVRTKSRRASGPLRARRRDGRRFRRGSGSRPA